MSVTAKGRPVVRVALNIWGNWNCYEGARQVRKYGRQFDAQLWLDDMVEAGRKVSPKSQLQPTCKNVT